MTPVSCVIPTHGRPALLARAVASASAQTRAPAEIIVVDDLGDAETRALIEALATKSAIPVRLVENHAEPGACGSRNLGARYATSAVLAFLDDDDEWRPTFLERLLAALDADGVDFALSHVERVFPDGRRQLCTTPPGLTAANVMRRQAYMTGSSFVVRRPAFEAVGGFDRGVPVFNDWDLFIRLVKSGARYAVVPEPLISWIEHGGERITGRSLRRADGIELFLARNGAGMSAGLRARYWDLATGMRQDHARSAKERRVAIRRMSALAGRGVALRVLALRAVASARRRLDRWSGKMIAGQRKDANSAS